MVCREQHFCLTPLSRRLLQTPKDHLNQHWNLLIAEQFWGTPKNLSLYQIMLMQSMWYFTDGLTDSNKVVPAESRWCTFASPWGSWALRLDERGQCGYRARGNMWGLRCSKPFSHAARAGPQSTANSRRCHICPVTSRRRRKTMQGDSQHTGKGAAVGRSILHPAPLSIAFGHTHDPNVW